MTSKEVIMVSPKGSPDDIVVVTVKSSWKDWMMMATAGAVGAIGGGLGVLWLQSLLIGTCL